MPSADHKLEKELQAAADAPEGVAARGILARGLRSRSFGLAARSAGIIAASLVGGLEGELEEALLRFLGCAPAADPGCQAKHAIADALYKLGTGRPELWLKGLRFRQMEPVWGGSIDTAGNLRGLCAAGLVASHYPASAIEVVGLLVDPLMEARGHAARALGELGTIEAEVVLRHKAMVGDEFPEVIAEVMFGLMRANPERSLEFVAGRLRDPEPTIREAAAGALGQSRLPEALAALVEAWESEPSRRDRAMLLPGFAQHRSGAARDFLLGVVEEAAEPLAMAAIVALRLYAHEDDCRERLRSIVRERGAEGLIEQCERILDE